MPPPLRENRRLNWPLFALAAAPLLFITVLIAKFGVNVPWGDEWEFLALIAKGHDGQLTFADLFSQHNEHRILFPKLIYVASALFAPWNQWFEMFFSVLLCMVTSLGILFLIRRTVIGSTPKHLLLWTLVNLLLFSPVQAENWLWGFQLQVFIPNLCLIASLAVLNSGARESLKFVAAFVLVSIATFSFGNGVLLWILVALHELLRGQKKLWLAAWLIAAGTVLTAYFTGYKRQPMPSPMTGDPLDYVAYFLGFLGGPFGRIPSENPLVLPGFIGAIALALYVGLLWWARKHRDAALRTMVPWLVIGSFAIANAALAASKRINWGAAQSLDPRYTTISTYLYLGLIGLFATAPNLAGSFSATIRCLRVPCLTAILTLYLVSLPGSVDLMAFFRQNALAGLGELQFSKVVDTSVAMRSHLMIHVHEKDLPGAIATVERLHLIARPLRPSAQLVDAQNRPQRSTPEFGVFDRLRALNSDTLEAAGWSFLPEKDRPAEAVVLAYEAGGNWTAFCLSDIREKRLDAAVKFRNRKLLESGWRKAFSRAALPATAEQISAWAFDPQADEVYKLPGNHLLKKP